MMLLPAHGQLRRCGRVSLWSQSRTMAPLRLRFDVKAFGMKLFFTFPQLLISACCFCSPHCSSSSWLPLFSCPLMNRIRNSRGKTSQVAPLAASPQLNSIKLNLTLNTAASCTRTRPPHLWFPTLVFSLFADNILFSLSSHSHFSMSCLPILIFHNEPWNLGGFSVFWVNPLTRCALGLCFL